MNASLLPPAKQWRRESQWSRFLHPLTLLLSGAPCRVELDLGPGGQLPACAKKAPKLWEKRAPQYFVIEICKADALKQSVMSHVFWRTVSDY